MLKWFVVAVSVCSVLSSPIPERRDIWNHWKSLIQEISNDIDQTVKRAADVAETSLTAAMMGKREFIVGKRNTGTKWEAHIADIAHLAGKSAEIATFTSLMSSAMTVSKRDDHYWTGLKDSFMTVAKAVGSAVESTVVKVLHETGLKKSRQTGAMPWMTGDDFEVLLTWLWSFYNWHPMTSTENNEWYPKPEMTDTHEWHPTEMTDAHKWHPTEMTDTHEWHSTEMTDAHKWHPTEVDTKEMTDASTQT